MGRSSQNNNNNINNTSTKKKKKHASLDHNHALFQSPLFWALTGLTGCLFLAAVVMHTMLLDVSASDETFSDDPLAALGSSGGDGMGRDHRQQWLRQQQNDKGGIYGEHRHHGNKHRQDRSGGGGSGGGLGNLFGLGGGHHRGGGGGGMEDKIANFKAHKEHERNFRQQNDEPSVREEFEQDHEYAQDNVSLEERVQTMRQPIPHPPPNAVPYDIYNCPATPPPNYPFVWSALDVLEHWNPDQTDVPSSHIHQSICVFDYHRDLDKAFAYRTAQVPFIVQQLPELLKTSLRWSTPNYLSHLVGTEPIRNEHSSNNHFMFWKTRAPVANFVPPTDMTDLTYDQWYARAHRLQEQSSNGAERDQTTLEHWYFRLNGMLEKHGYLYEELPFFDPSLGPSLTMIHPEEHRGINCRFGMKGVIAESHYDSSSNFIALMGGQRRYILAHPDQCQHMELYPQAHPSGRHSAVNWSTVVQEVRHDNVNADRPFAKAQVNEVVLQAGDMLYLPTYWFHFIVSLNINFQCNSRSGESYEYQDPITKCGFDRPAPHQKDHRRQ